MTVRYFQRLSYDEEEHPLTSSFGPGQWLTAYLRRDSALTRQLILDYLVGNTIAGALEVIANAENKQDRDHILDWFVEELRNQPLGVLKDSLRDSKYMLKECEENVPQISSFEGSTLTILDILFAAGKPLGYVNLGYHLFGREPGRNIVARRKYGENASKFAALLDLVAIGHDLAASKPSRQVAVTLTEIGRAVQRAKGDRMEIVVRLFLRVALFRDVVCVDGEGNLKRFDEVLSRFSQATRHRRASAFSWMIKTFSRYGGKVDDATVVEGVLWKMRH